MWKGRKCAFSAVGRLSPDFIVQDGVVPRARLGEALAAIEALARAARHPRRQRLPRRRRQPAPADPLRRTEPGAHERAEALAADILRLCIRLGGSITGEHGVGLEKRAFLAEMYGEATSTCMQRLRQTMDPAEIANRGKMLRRARHDLPRTAAPPTRGVDPARMTCSRRHAERSSGPARRAARRGGGTKRPLGAAGEATVSTSRGLAGITDYTPDECMFTASAGTPLADIERRLAREGQYLPFDPPLARAGATIGGTVAAGLNGPGR